MRLSAIVILAKANALPFDPCIKQDYFYFLILNSHFTVLRSLVWVVEEGGWGGPLLSCHYSARSKENTS